MTKALPCIYGLVHPETGELRYVGKANCPKERLAGHIRDSHRKSVPSAQWVQSLHRDGLRPELLVLSDQCEDWESEERAYISRARSAGHRLLNVSDGGAAPYCPVDVRRENGRKSAAKRNPVMSSLIRELGNSAKFLESRGDLLGVQAMRSCQSYLRSLKGPKEDWFVGEWLDRKRKRGNGITRSEA